MKIIRKLAIKYENYKKTSNKVGKLMRLCSLSHKLLYGNMNVISSSKF